MCSLAGNPKVKSFKTKTTHKRWMVLTINL